MFLRIGLLLTGFATCMNASMPANVAIGAVVTVLGVFFTVHGGLNYAFNAYPSMKEKRDKIYQKIFTPEAHEKIKAYRLPAEAYRSSVLYTGLVLSVVGRAVLMQNMPTSELTTLAASLLLPVVAEGVNTLCFCFRLYRDFDKDAPQTPIVEGSSQQ